jgi:hypothetical protein
MTQPPDPTQAFAVNLAALAREIAMDIFPLSQILGIHKLSDAEWEKIQAMQHFQQMLANMIGEWESAMNTRERVKAKAQTGLEMNLESLVLAMADDSIPLTQRVEAGKFLARLGELDGQVGASGPGFSITLNIGGERTQVDVQPKVIDHVD